MATLVFLEAPVSDVTVTTTLILMSLEAVIPPQDSVSTAFSTQKASHVNAAYLATLEMPPGKAV